MSALLGRWISNSWPTGPRAALCVPSVGFWKDVRFRPRLRENSEIGPLVGCRRHIGHHRAVFPMRDLAGHADLDFILLYYPFGH